jgi:hypothetical protein
MNEQVRPVREGFQPMGGPQQQPPRPIQQNGGPGQGPIIDVQPEENPAMESAPPPPPLEAWPITVRLVHKPIRNNIGVEVRELKFREPTGGDINRCGNPVRINSEGDVVIDERKMSLIMANLSGVLSPLLDGMDPRDWNSCAYRLRSFFLPDPAAW